MLGEIVTKSYHIVRNHPYLWLLAFLAGELCGGGVADYANGNFKGDFAGNKQGEIIAMWVQDHFFALLGILGALFVLGIVLWFVSCIAEGGIIYAVSEIDMDHQNSFKASWKRGIAFFWRILGLRVLLGLVTLGGSGILVGSLLAIFLNMPGRASVLLVLGIIFLAFLLFLFFLLLIPLGLIGLIAQRVIVLEGTSTMQGLREAYELIKKSWKDSLFLYVASIGINIILGIAVTVGEIVCALPFIILFYTAYGAKNGLAIITIGAVGIGIVVALGIFLSSVAGCYLSVYWTLAFQRLKNSPLS